MTNEDFKNLIIGEDFIAHYGVKGMRWGVRRKARKDAVETARAKQFYGEGAGTRRKLIKAKVEGRSKASADYKKAFDEYLAKQDSAKAASRAISERRRKDAGKTVKQTTGYVARRVTGEMGTNAAFAAVALGGLAFVTSPRGQRIIQKGVTKARNAQQSRVGRKLVQDFIKSQGK